MIKNLKIKLFFLFIFMLVSHSFAGEVWINEINVEDGYYDEMGFVEGTGTNGYVEIIGRAGTDISNWSLEMYNSQNSNVFTYTISSNTKLQNDKDGYGFFVFGAPLVQNKDLILTNDFENYSDSPNYIEVPGGLILRSASGEVESKICYNPNHDSLTAVGFEYIGDDFSSQDDPYGGEWIPAFKSLQLNGTGSNYVDFSWSWTNGFTPGMINSGQVLLGGSTNLLVFITDYWFDGTNLYIVSEGTGDWNTPEVWSATNLSVGTNGWSKLGGVTNAGSSSVVTQWFTIPSSPPSPTIYYRIKGQEN